LLDLDLYLYSTLLIFWQFNICSFRSTFGFINSISSGSTYPGLFNYYCIACDCFSDVYPITLFISFLFWYTWFIALSKFYFNFIALFLASKNCVGIYYSNSVSLLFGIVKLFSILVSLIGLTLSPIFIINCSNDHASYIFSRLWLP